MSSRDHAPKTGSMKIIFDDREMKSLIEAFEKCPLSLPLREALWCELGRFKGVDGFLDCSHITTTETGDWRVLGRIGRAGELFMAAFRALTIASEREGQLGVLRQPTPCLGAENTNDTRA